MKMTIRNSFIVASVGSFASELATSISYEAEWEQFKTTYAKVYSQDSDSNLLGGVNEERLRFETFKSNLVFVRTRNAQNLTYTLGLNEFADMTAEEFFSRHTGLLPSSPSLDGLPRLGTHEHRGHELPSEVDWEVEGKVTPAKNQGQCGACWAFSATGALEGAWAIETGDLLSLSEQQLVDCEHVDDNCKGGLMDHAFAYAMKFPVCTDSSYAYEHKFGTCRKSCGVGIPKGSVTGFMDVHDSEHSLMDALVQQPVSVAIEGDKRDFQLYKSGVLSGACGSKVNHGVLAVGYGTLNGNAYWKLKNSWGSSWGEKGFVKIHRSQSRPGDCGILSGPLSYPVVSSGPDIVV